MFGYDDGLDEKDGKKGRERERGRQNEGETEKGAK